MPETFILGTPEPRVIQADDRVKAYPIGHKVEEKSSSEGFTYSRLGYVWPT